MSRSKPSASRIMREPDRQYGHISDLRSERRHSISLDYMSRFGMSTSKPAFCDGAERDLYAAGDERSGRVGKAPLEFPETVGKRTFFGAFRTHISLIRTRIPKQSGDFRNCAVIFRQMLRADVQIADNVRIGWTNYRSPRCPLRDGLPRSNARTAGPAIPRWRGGRAWRGLPFSFQGRGNTAASPATAISAPLTTAGCRTNSRGPLTQSAVPDA